jgi:hypothetical protein
MFWPAIAVVASVTAACWAAATVVLGVRYDRLRRRGGMS